MQRYRSLLHILDSLVEKGHEVYVPQNGPDTYSADDWFEAPWDINVNGPGTFRHLCTNFGLQVKHLDEVRWLPAGKEPQKPDAILGTDHIPFESELQVNLPYMGFSYSSMRDKIQVGNGMCDEIRKRQSMVAEKKGKLLIIYPGGGRTILSPLRRHIPREDVIENSIRLLNAVLQQIPRDTVSEIVIKTHPAPYLECNAESVQNTVLPHLLGWCPIGVTDKGLIGLICECEFILSFGSSTVIWLLGSEKKWLNVVECAKYDLDSPKRRDQIVRAKDWHRWPQNVALGSLPEAFADYNSIAGQARALSFFSEYQALFQKDCTSAVVSLMEKEAVGA